MKWPRALTRVKGALVAAFERMLMPILYSFTFGNANVTINPKKKKKKLHHNRVSSSVRLPGHTRVPRRCTRVSTQPRIEACRA